MVGGTSVILSYKAHDQPGPDGSRSPSTCRRWRRASGCRSHRDEPDEELWEQMSANYPTIEFGA